MAAKKDKEISISWPKQSMVFFAVVIIITLLSMILAVFPPVAKWFGELIDVGTETVQEWSQNIALIGFGLILITVGLKVMPIFPWVGVPLAILGVVTVGFALFNLWESSKDLEPE